MIAEAADLLVAAAFVSGMAVLVTVRSVRAALGVFLDVLLAAGLLRLSIADTWGAIAAAAALIAVRKLAVSGLGQDLSPPPPSRPAG